MKNEQSTREKFEEWLTQCPVDYYEAFGRDTYMFIVREETDEDT